MIEGGRDNRERSHMKDWDWTCPKCQNHNFAWRDKCNRCEVLKSEVVGKNQGGGRRGGGGGYRGGGEHQTIVVETDAEAAEDTEVVEIAVTIVVETDAEAAEDTEVVENAETIVVETDAEAAEDTEVVENAETIVVETDARRREIPRWWRTPRQSWWRPTRGRVTKRKPRRGSQ